MRGSQTHTWGLTLLAGLLASCGARSPTVEGAAPVTAVRPPATCGGCHEVESRTWEISMHHASYSSPDFQASLREEPLDFCVSCHAPRRGALGVAAGNARGIDCVSCHLGAERHEALARSAPGSLRTNAAGSPVACATCHELASVASATLLQSTASEHAASRYRDVPCASCHAKRDAQGHVDHGFRVSRDPERLARAIMVRDVARDVGAVRFTLASVGVGHKLPTGDVFRALQVRAWAEDANTGRIVADVETSLHRDWDAHRRAFGQKVAPP